MELHAGRDPAVSNRWVDLTLFYLFQLNPILYVDPDLGRWFVTGSLRRSWWCSSGRGRCRGTATKNGEKPHCTKHSAPAILQLHLLASHRRDTRGCLKTLFRGSLRKVHHTNTAVRGHPEQYPIALLGRATCPMNIHQVPWCLVLESLKFGESTVQAPVLFHLCEHHRDTPGPPPSAPPVAWAPWLNDSWQIPGFPDFSLRDAAPPG